MRLTGDDDGAFGGTIATKEPSSDDSHIKTDPANMASDRTEDGPSQVFFVPDGESRARINCAA